jgi:hypothetical protein
VSDSYAYSEEAIAAGCLPHLIRLTATAESDQETSGTVSQQHELALSCTRTLLYMLEESSAPQLFRQGLIPLLEDQKIQTCTNNSGVIRAEGISSSTCGGGNSCDIKEEIYTSIEKIRCLVFAER